MITIVRYRGRIFDETLPLLRAAGVAVRDDPETSRKRKSIQPLLDAFAPAAK